MSTLDAKKMREELALQEAIKRQADAVVKLANQAIAGLPQNTRLEKSQFSNLLNVAQSLESVEVIVNYLRYQMGREQKLWGTGDTDLAHVIIRHIRTDLKHLADQQIAAYLKERNIEAQRERLQEAHFLLMSQYIGYLRRAFVYGESRNEGRKDNAGFAQLPDPKTKEEAAHA
jgi:phage/plasmid-associated DNA primase